MRRGARGARAAGGGRGAGAGDRREAMLELLQPDDLIDLAIPRGGEGLIRFVAEARTGAGDQALQGRLPPVRRRRRRPRPGASACWSTARPARPGVCNALETLLVDRGDRAGVPAARAGRAARARRGAARRRARRGRCVAGAVEPATEADWDAEYLDLILAVRVVDGLDGALAHIARHGSRPHRGHRHRAMTRAASRFLREVDAVRR